ncbi:Sodium/hydrogen exchanger family protein [Melghirimyces thermohalophilus]|uniref:Sodium/hydrogen exchanger family protein n=1 Tax=Melghirimyces thermohalophilus TaxID=1236220 RepID=A0A1G6N1Y4_9BACL|nr:Sodium/hydrogen exchanger family protein [Melghirimyces thermohalophilus]
MRLLGRSDHHPDPQFSQHRRLSLTNTPITRQFGAEQNDQQLQNNCIALLDDLNRNRNSSLIVAVGGVILPLAGGYLGEGGAFGLEQQGALFLGLLLSATSVSITVQTLKDLIKTENEQWEF